MKRTNLNVFALFAILSLLSASIATARPEVLNDKLTVDGGGSIELISGASIDFQEGSELNIEGTQVTASASELNGLDGVTATATELNTSSDASLLDNATGSNGVTTAVETVQPVQKLVVTLDDVTLVATDSSAEGESQQIATFPAGNISVLSSVANMSVVSSAGATNVFVMAVGTVAASDAADLTGTEVDLIPSTSIDTTAGTVHTNAFDAVLGAAASFDGTTTAVALFLNYGIVDADMDANVTNVVTGTLTLMYIDGGDNQ